MKYQEKQDKLKYLKRLKKGWPVGSDIRHKLSAKIAQVENVYVTPPCNPRISRG